MIDCFSGLPIAMPHTTCSRRSFLTSTLAAGGALAAAGARGQEAVPRKYKYIDVHTHVGTFYWGKELTADELVRMMDEHAIEKACVLPLVSPESTPYLQPT